MIADLQPVFDIAVIVVIVLAVSFLLTGIVILVLNIIESRRLAEQRSVMLELTPPANIDKTPEATKQLFAVLHGLRASLTTSDKLLRRKVVFSLELTSTKERGIRYLLRVPEDDVSSFEHTVLSYIPDAKLRRVEDQLLETLNSGRGRIIELKQFGHFAYPLHTQFSLDEHDPMAYLTGAMTKLESGEVMAVQLVTSPVMVREADAIAGRMLHNDEFIYQLGKRRLRAGGLLRGINSLLFGILESIGDIVSGPSYAKSHSALAGHHQQVAARIKPARVLSPFEQQLAESVQRKISQPLFSVNARVLIVTNNKQRERQRVKGLREWASAFAIPKYQSLRVRHNFARSKRRRFFAFQYRLPSLFRRGTIILSAAELADLYHFPHSQAAKTENVVKSLSKALPAPLSLKNNPDFDVILGCNYYHGSATDIGLTVAERERHMYVIGGTGNGKTTMLQYQIVQDMQNGKGLAVVDPHGDMAEALLRHVPTERINDVVYFNPDDLEYPVGLNLLELTPGLTGNELLREKDIITESVVSVFRKIFSDADTGGHRIEYVLRNTIQTALTVPDATLFTVFDLLNDPKYRKSVIKTLEDKNLVNFWKNELGKAGDMQKVKMAAGITSKIGRFLFSASARQILEQPKSTIDFDDIINSGKIMICNFSKGLLGEDTSELFGITVLAKLQLASLCRARMSQKERRAFYLYVDEFQNFATQSFVQMLSESRKYKLFMIMAEQSTSQQDDQQMVGIVLANVGTVVCFRTGNPQDERVLLPLFSPYIEQGEINNLPAFNFYARLSAVHAQEPLSGQTLLLHGNGSDATAASVIEHSRAMFAKRQDVEEVDPQSIEPKDAIAKKKSPTFEKSTKTAMLDIDVTG